jgi:hypothetical protein
VFVLARVCIISLLGLMLMVLLVWCAVQKMEVTSSCAQSKGLRLLPATAKCINNRVHVHQYF